MGLYDIIYGKRQTRTKKERKMQPTTNGLMSIVSRLRGGIFLLALLFGFATFAETDICGNEIFSYTENNVTKTYRFIVSGDPRIEVSAAATSAASHNCVSNDDVAFVALFKSIFTTVFEKAFKSTPYSGFCIDFN